MNDSFGRARPWVRRAAVLAAMACVGLLAPACGGGSSLGASAMGGATRTQAALAYARCMRSHGVPGFPDPDGNGNFHLSASQQRGGSAGGGSDSASPQEAAANQVCNHVLNVGPQLNAAQTQHALSQLVKYAECMRAHGVANFPDPHTTDGGIGVPSGIGFDVSGIDIHSPAFQSASRACQPLAAHAKG